MFPSEGAGGEGGAGGGEGGVSGGEGAGRCDTTSSSCVDDANWIVFPAISSSERAEAKRVDVGEGAVANGDADRDCDIFSSLWCDRTRADEDADRDGDMRPSRCEDCLDAVACSGDNDGGEDE